MTSPIENKIRGEQNENYFTNCNLSIFNTEGRLMAINEKYLAMAWNDKGTINIVDSNNPSDLDMYSSSFFLNDYDIIDMEFSPFDNRIISYSNENNDVCIAKFTEKLEIDKIHHFKEIKKVNFINFNPVASNLICNGSIIGDIFIWDTIKMHVFSEISLNQKPNSILWSPNGSLIGFISTNILSAYDPRSKLKPIFEYKYPVYNSRPKFAWLSNESLVAVHYNKNKDKKFLSLYDIRQSQQNPYSSIEIDPKVSRSIIIPFVNQELKIIYTTKENENEINIFDYSSGYLQKKDVFYSSEPSKFSIQLNRKYLDKKKFEMDRLVRYTNNNKIYYISFFLNETNYYPSIELDTPQMTSEEWFNLKPKEPPNINNENLDQNKENNLNDNNINGKEKNKELENLNNKKEELKKQNRELYEKYNKINDDKITDNEIKEKEKIISDLTLEIKNKEKKYEEELSYLKSNIKSKEKEMSDIYIEKEELIQQIKQLNEDMKLKEEKIKSLENNINLKKENEQKYLSEKNKSEKEKPQKDYDNLKNTIEELNKKSNEVKTKNKSENGSEFNGFEIITKDKVIETNQLKQEQLENIKENNKVIEEYSQKIIKPEQEIEKTKIELDNSKKQIEEKEQLIGKLNEKITEIENNKNDKLKEQTELNEKLNNEIEKLKANLNENENNRIKIEEEKQKISKELSEEKYKKEQLTNEYHNKIKELNDKINLYENNRELEKDKEKTLLNQIEEFKLKFSELKKDIDEKNGELTNNKNLIKNKEDLIDTLQKKVNELDKEIKDKQNKETINEKSLVNQLNLELEQIKKNNSELLKERKEFEKKITELENEKERNLKKINQLESDILEIKNAKDEKSQTNETQLKQSQETLPINKDKNENISDLLEEIRKLKEEDESNKKIIKELNSTKSELNNQINDLNTQVSKLDKQLKENTQKYSDLQNQFDKYKTSTTEQIKNYDNQINKSKKDQAKLLKLIKESNDKLKNHEITIKNDQNEISNLKKQNSENENVLKSQIEQIKDQYKKISEEEIKKIRKGLFKNIGDILKNTKNNYSKLYDEKEKEFNSKIGELSNLVSNSKMNLKGEQSINFSKIDNKNLSNKDNNIPSTNNNGKQENIGEREINTNDNKGYNSNNNNHNYNIIIKKNKQNDNSDNQKNKVNNDITTDKNLNNENNNKDQIINFSNSNIIQQEYSFDCTNLIYLTENIYQGTDEAKFEIKLKNIGEKAWCPNSKLITDTSSNCKTDDVILSPQKPNEEKGYNIIIKNLKDYPVGEYKAVFLFWSEGKTYGDNITAIINIIDKDNQEKKDNNKDVEYSFDCTNMIYLSVYIYQGTDEAKFDLYLKNTGKKAWNKNAKLLVEKSSNYSCDDIVLSPQKPDEEKHYKVTIKNLKDNPIGEYKVVFLFSAEGNIYGEGITAIIKIIEKENKNKEIDEYMDKIIEFRNTFSLDEKEYSNEKILDILKDNDFHFEKAFTSLYS